MRIVFIGAVQFSESSLSKLVSMDAEVVGVCTLSESPHNADHVDLAPFCESCDIPVLHVDDVNSRETIHWIREKHTDIIFCFGWSRLLKKELLNLAPLGVLGYHPAALPANRGRHPLIWALALGLSETASTFFFMDEGADSGDILSQSVLPITENDDAASLYQRMTESALAQIEEFLPQLVSGEFPRTPQDHSKANAWRKRGIRDGAIDWRMSATSIHNLVRALAKPYVGAHFLYCDQEVKVWRSEIVSGVAPNLEHGKVLSVDESGPIIKAGTDALKLVQFEPESTNLKPNEYL
jgi:methionyl-tRNA formyltransferase